jgi:predicted nucleotidyltransferase
MKRSKSKMVKIEFYPKEKLKKEILEIVGKYLDLKKYKVFFFGSRVTGRHDERSDIDIGIEGPERIPLEILSAIREEIDKLPTLYHIDVVDFKSVGKDFYKVAKQNLELILK